MVDQVIRAINTLESRDTNVQQGQWLRDRLKESNHIGYCFDVRLVEQRGGYTAYVAQLPGVISEGDEAAEALTNIREAFIAVIKTYKDEGMPTPWRKPEPLAPDESEFRVAVHV